MRRLIPLLAAVALLAGCSSNSNNAAPAPAKSATVQAVVTVAATQTVTRAPQSPTAAPAAIRTPTPVMSASGHSWYTSSASNATNYYCDDDPGWQALAAANLKQYPTAAALKAAYPGRTLHQPCKDGATDP
jgi:hypothetical protein